MGVVVRGNFPQLVKKDLYGYFFETYDSIDAVYPRIFEVVKSDAPYEQGTTAVGMGLLSERQEGEHIRFHDPAEGRNWYIRNHSYSDGFILSDELLRDTNDRKLTNLIQETARTWAESVRQTEETFCAQLLNQGAMTAGDPAFNASIPALFDDPSGDLIYDSKSFFNADHRSLLGGSYNNYAASAGLDESNLSAAYQAVADTNAHNERDVKVKITPDVLLVPPALGFTAHKLLDSTLVPGGALNDANALKGLLEPIVWRYLSDTDGWFVGQAKKGLRFLDRESPIIDVWQEPETKQWKCTMTRRFGAGVTNWRFWRAANIASS